MRDAPPSASIAAASPQAPRPARRLSLLCLAALGLSSLTGCEVGGGGVEPASFVVPLSELSGGVVFAAQSIPGSKGFDLWWAKIPSKMTTVVQPVQLTDSEATDMQPTLAKDTPALAFAREDGIYFVREDGSLVQLTDTENERYVDMQPALSDDARYLAWVRVDTQSELPGDSGAHPSVVMIRSVSEGVDARVVSKSSGSVNQFGPAFRRGDTTQLSWAEVNMDTGATRILIGAWRDGTTRQLCSGSLDNERCRATQLRWPHRGMIVATALGSDTLEELPLSETDAPESMVDVLKQQIEISSPLSGRFPDSVAYNGALTRMVLEVWLPSYLGSASATLYLATPDGESMAGLQIAGFSNEPDKRLVDATLPVSMRTPQLVAW